MEDLDGGTPVDAAALADLTTPFAVRVAATLGVAGHLAAGPLTVAELARRCGAVPDLLARLLRHLVRRGLFTEPSPDVFAGNAASAVLAPGQPGALRDWLDLDGALGRADLAFAELLRTVRTGRNAYAAAFGRPFHDDLDGDPAFRDSFNHVMDDKTHRLAPHIAARYDWGRVRHVADVGGGVGALLIELLSAHPWLVGTLIDRPETAKRAKILLGEHGVLGRCQVHGGSFFDPLPTGADVYVVCDVLEDWDDEHARVLLSRCADAGGPAGRVLVIEPLPVDTRSALRFTDLDLRLLTYTNGRMRTEADLGRVAEAAGLRIRQMIPVAGSHAIIECEPA